MNANFQFALGKVLKSEGGYVNDPHDPGGPTNLGVTIWEAKSIGLDVNHDGKVDTLDIKALTPADAGKIFKALYWDKVRGDDLPSGVDFALFDFAINSGVARAAIFLQECVDTAPDGKIGPLTIAAARRIDPVRLINLLCDDRLDFLRRLSTFNHFGHGWTARVAEVRADSIHLATIKGAAP